MATAQELRKIELLKADHTQACKDFLGFVSENAKAIWDWKHKIEVDPYISTMYNFLLDQVDEAKKILTEFQSRVLNKRPYVNKGRRKETV